MKKNPFLSLCVALFTLFLSPLFSWAIEKNVLFCTDEFDTDSRLEAKVYTAANSGGSVSVSLLQGAGSFTLAAWVKVNTASASLSHRYLPIMVQTSSGGGSFRLYYDVQLGQFVFGRDTTNSIRDDRYLHATPEDASKWTFVTAMYDQEGQEIRLYLNGVLCDSKAATDTITLNSNNYFRAAYDGMSGARYFRGHLAEMSVWRKALTVPQIQSIMRARPTLEELADCAAYWPMSVGGAAVIVDDVSGHGSILSLDKPDRAVLGTEVTDFPEFEAPSRNVLYFSRRHAESANGQVRPNGDKRVITTDGSFSISGWVKLSPTMNERPEISPIFTQDPTNTRKVRLYYEKSSQSFVFERMDQAGDALDPNPVKVQCLTPSQWNYITAVYDKENATRSLYLNGALAASITDTAVFAPNCTFFRFGYSYALGHENYLRGYLAEWSVWDSALDAEKIQSIMSARPVDEELEGCLAYWTFDETYSEYITDVTPSRTYQLKITLPQRVISSTECIDFPEFSEGLGIPYSVTVVMPTGDIATVTENSQTDREDGKYYEGSTVSFTAQSATHEFVRWYGDVPENQVSNATISVVIDKDMRISPYFRPTQWTYNPSAKTITDGYWVLGVTVSGNTMKLNEKCTKNDPLVGMLDFSLPIENGAYSMVTLGIRSFFENKVVREVHLPDTLTTIEQSAFYYCTSLETVTPFLPDTVTKIGPTAFHGCTSLKGDLQIQSLTAPFEWIVGGTDGVFRQTKITSVTLGANVTNIPPRAFHTCSELVNVEMLGPIQSIGIAAFINCSKLERVTPFLPDTIHTIEGNIFQNCTKLDGDLVIAAKKHTVTLGEYCFDNLGIKSVYLGPGVLVVPNRAIRNNYQLTNVTVRGATTLGPAAFANLTALTDVYLETKPTLDSGTAPFYGCANFTRIHLASTNDAWTAFIEDPANMTPWEEVPTNAKSIYTSRYEGEPLGRLTKASGYLSAVGGGWILRWKVPSDLEKVTVILFR